MTRDNIVHVDFGRHWPRQYIEQPDGTVRLANDMNEFYEAFRNRRARQDEVVRDGEELLVSTVFLGIDHNFGDDGPPILYETMIFGGSLEGETRRYCTREDAMACHENVLAWLNGDVFEFDQEQR